MLQRGSFRISGFSQPFAGQMHWPITGQKVFGWMAYQARIAWRAVRGTIDSLSAQLCREVDEIGRVDLGARIRLGLLDVGDTVLARTVDVGRPKPGGASTLKITDVRRDHHHLVGPVAEKLGSGTIDPRVRFV